MSGCPCRLEKLEQKKFVAWFFLHLLLVFVCFVGKKVLDYIVAGE